MAMPMVDDTVCPLCGGPNGCAVAQGSDPAGCWCMRTPIAPEAIAQAARQRPPDAGPQQCICPHCGAPRPAMREKETPCP